MCIFTTLLYLIAYIYIHSIYTHAVNPPFLNFNILFKVFIFYTKVLLLGFQDKLQAYLRLISLV